MSGSQNCEIYLFGQTRFVTVLLVKVGGAAEKYARARSGDTAFFISLQTEHKKQGEET